MDDQSQTTPKPESEEAAEYINALGLQFDKLCVERHEKGQQEYGTLTFLQNDVIRMMMEELADTANYCRYQFVKLMMLQERLENLVDESEDGINIGAQAFKGVGEVGWKKP